MGRLIYSAITSLDGYVEDADGSFDWAEPDEEVHGFVNDQERSVATYLYGRRMHETMVWWADPPAEAMAEPVIADYAAVWQAAQKVVVSRTLDRLDQPRTRVVPELTPALVKEVTADGDVSIGGAELAGQALRLGLVEEVRLFLNPVAVGGGKPALPLGVRVDLELLEERRFAGGVVLVRYGVRRG